MSSGYTRVKANMAPAEPAAACPTGGRVSLVMVMAIDNERDKEKRIKGEKDLI
jgi:hypothetical protein